MAIATTKTGRFILTKTSVDSGRIGDQLDSSRIASQLCSLLEGDNALD
jgi:hypothetical protein